MKDKDLRERLIVLGSGRLADALIDLASRSDEVADVITRLVATPDENKDRFIAKLSSLRESQRFIDWQEGAYFARELEGLLADLREGVDDPKTGVELIAEFYECDRSIFERCDDSSGSIGDIFRDDARELFIRYAAECEDKEWLCERLLKLYENDDYGVRDALVDAASSFLPTESLRVLAGRLWERSEKGAGDFFYKRHWLGGVESLARQLGDAALFEQARTESWPKLSAPACIDIAKVYLESGDAKKALSWMEQIPDEEHFRQYERDQLLLAIHQELGNQEKSAEIVWHIFLNHRNKANLETLLHVIGEKERGRVIEEQCRQILNSEQVSLTDAQFMIDMDRINDTAAYILDHQDQLNGERYGSLLPIVSSMEETEHWLPAIVIYRALLQSILRRAQSKYYHHGVRYLRKLDDLALKTFDWRHILPHGEYKDSLLQSHGRKRSFWSKYGQ